MKKFKFKFLLVALPMLFAACGNDEPPTPPGGNDAENQTPTVSEEKPILFETKSMFWKTGYDAALNVYSTYCVDTHAAYGGHDIVYRYLDGADNPGKLLVTEFSIEKGGETRVFDVSKIKEQAEASDNGFFEVEIEGVTLKYTIQGEFVVSYASETEAEAMEMLAANIQSKFYNIKLEGDNNYKSIIRIEDGIEKTAGMYPLLFDLAAIEYPTDRGYDFNGAKCGCDYYVYLPADASAFPIVCDMSKNALSRKHFYLTNIRQQDSDGNSVELPLNLVEDEEIEGGWFYTKESTVGLFVHNEFYKLECRITENTTGKERRFELVLSPNWEYAAIGALIPASFHVIQAAK